MKIRFALPAALVAALLLCAASASRAQRSCSLSSFGIAADGAMSREQVCVVFDDLTYLSALALAGQGEGFTSMFGSGDPAHAGQRLIAWLRTRITSLTVGNVADALAANLGHATRAGSTPGTTYPYGRVILTPAFFTSSRIRRLGTYIHEARHSDGDHYLSAHLVDDGHPDTSHGHCRTARLAGSPDAASGAVHDSGCDPHFNGAYAFGAVFFSNLSRSCAACTQDERDEARRLALDSAMHHLEVPLGDDGSPPL